MLNNNCLESPERVFVEHWEKLNKINGKGVLDCLLTSKYEVTERDRQVAVTVIQWLGSPVGIRFLREVVEDLTQ